MENQSLLLEPLKDKRVLLGGPENKFREILTNGERIYQLGSLANLACWPLDSISTWKHFPKTLFVDLLTMLLHPSKVPSIDFDFLLKLYSAYFEHLKLIHIFVNLKRQ